MVYSSDSREIGVCPYKLVQPPERPEGPPLWIDNARKNPQKHISRNVFVDLSGNYSAFWELYRVTEVAFGIKFAYEHDLTVRFTRDRSLPIQTRGTPRTSRRAAIMEF